MAWIVLLKGCTENQWLNHRKATHDLHDTNAKWDGHAELSVCRQGVHGEKSWGWPDEDKIILEPTNPGARSQRRLQYKQAQLMAEAFNKAGI